MLASDKKYNKVQFYFFYKTNKTDWYPIDLAESKKLMLAYCTIFKIQTLVQNLKKSYRKQILKAKKMASQSYIDQSADTCRAAWNVISGETAPKKPKK